MGKVVHTRAIGDGRSKPATSFALIRDNITGGFPGVQPLAPSVERIHINTAAVRTPEDVLIDSFRIHCDSSTTLWVRYRLAIWLDMGPGLPDCERKMKDCVILAPVLGTEGVAEESRLSLTVQSDVTASLEPC